MTRAALALLAFLAARAAAATSAAPVEPLDTLVPRLMREGDVPGVSLALVKDGRVVSRRAFGVKEMGKPARVDEETVFEAASLSKPVFAYVVLRLADKRTLDLDAPLTSYLTPPYVDDARLPLVTARRVLTHTTGFPNWRPRGGPLVFHFAPGERFSYSGEGFVYLQKAVERRTGKTLEALAKELVFAPLGMTSTSYVYLPRYAERKATGHDEIGNPKVDFRPTEANAAASLHTTAGDYARFLAACLEGRGLSRKSAAAMVRPDVRVDEGCQSCVSGKPSGRLSKEIGWGLGWGVEETSRGPAIWHWGDNGGSGFHCIVVGLTKEKRGLVAFTNSLAGHGILPDIAEAALGVPQPAFRWISYERYDSPARVFYKRVLAEGGAALGEMPQLTEKQVNSIGYWLLAKKRLPEAVAVFERNASDHADSANVHDSLGEAYAAAGQRERAIASYERVLALEPGNANAVEELRKLRAGDGASSAVPPESTPAPR